MAPLDPADRVVDTARYPLADPAGRTLRAVVSTARRELAGDGCCVLRDFVREPLRAVLRAECAALAPLAHYDVETVNVYNTAPDDSLPADHPARVVLSRGNAFVARDLIPSAAVIHLLYTSTDFRRFVADCFELPELHEYADPLAGLCLNVVEPGRAHPWHFDTNEFTVSMLTQAPEGGGRFQYCPSIRTAARENLADVRAVLDGRGEQLVRTLELRPGDLQLFKGRYSLHRVSTVSGGLARHSAIFAYSERPGVIGSVARTRQLFGRVLPQHLVAEHVRVDQLMD